MERGMMHIDCCMPVVTSHCAQGATLHVARCKLVCAGAVWVHAKDHATLWFEEGAAAAAGGRDLDPLVVSLARVLDISTLPGTLGEQAV
jgi:hypothetical protein